MSEQFHLENSNFSSSLTSSLCSLLSSSSLCDCTIICSDGQLSAHKVILAATSSFFSSVFSLHHHNHPLIYLRGIKTDQMQAVLPYIYAGGTQVAKEDLSSFLAIAEDLQVEGLTRKFENPTTEKIKDAICEDMKSTPWKNKDEMAGGTQVAEDDPPSFLGAAEDLKIEGLTRKFRTQDKIKDKIFEDTNRTLWNNKDEMMNEVSVKIDQLEKDNEKDSCHEDSKVQREKTMEQLFSNNELNNVKHTLEFANTTELFPSADNNFHKKHEKAKNNATISVDNRFDDCEHVVDGSSGEIAQSNRMKPKTKSKLLKRIKLDSEHERQKDLDEPNQAGKSLHCPVCNFGVPTVFNLNFHMRSKQQVQCKECKLYFGTCQSIFIHKKGRCKGNTRP